MSVYPFLFCRLGDLVACFFGRHDWCRGWYRGRDARGRFRHVETRYCDTCGYAEERWPGEGWLPEWSE
jgi:hypothetical protein